MNQSRAIVGLLLAATVLAAPASVAANGSSDGDTDAIAVGPQPAWFLMGGPTSGISWQSTGIGGFVGAELSVVRLHRSYWIGAYTDGLYDFGSRAPIVSLGPTIGYGLVGLDGGVGVRFRHGGPEVGPVGRISATAGLFGLFARGAYWPRPDEHTLQFGATLKFPLTSPWGGAP
ncbi:MAG: hypothetical protein ABEN55_16300 [Bradymonadaceae bacterium]